MNTLEILSMARKVANVAHDSRGQLYADRPYSTHLDLVDSLLVDWLELGDVPEGSASALHTRIGGRFHDYFEDVVPTAESHTHHLLGLNVFHGIPMYGLILALRCTDEPGATRQERKQKTYPKIRETCASRMIKLADRVSHLRFGRDASQHPEYKKLRMYVSEDSEFQTGVIGGSSFCEDYEFLGKALQVAEVSYWREMRDAKRFLERYKLKPGKAITRRRRSSNKTKT